MSIFRPLIIIALVVIVGVGAYLGYSHLSSNTSLPLPPLPQITNSQTVPTFSGVVTPVGDLGLIIQTEDEKLNNINPNPFYYSAGVYQNTKYQGYTRYVAIRGSVDPTGPAAFVFASKDGQTFVIDGSSLDAADPNKEINREKVTQADVLPSAHLATIDLTDPFALSKNKIEITNQTSEEKDEYGNQIVNSVLLTSFSNLMSMESKFSYLKYYSQPWQQNSFYDQLPPAQKKLENIKNDNFATTTEVIVTDSTNLPYSYDLATTQNITGYGPAQEKYQSDMVTYQQNVKASPSGNFNYPIAPMRPNLRMSQSQITTSYPLYQKYDVAFPEGCSLDVNTVVLKNLTASQLSKLGSSPLGDVYTLADINSPLYFLQYSIKTSDSEGWKYNNKGPIPTLHDYVEKNPLLLFQDPWQRWVVLGEYDYILAGGCGKPVIYLYPETETEVKITFTQPIDLTLSIPSYSNGWKVKAKPNGELIDLQPEMTKCSNLTDNRFGSEYALASCQTNTYPYIYWEGNGLTNSYPQVETGWVVSKGDLVSFMNNLLNKSGFNPKEKSDMLSYWLPRMQKEASSYYLIKWLQNREMNEIAPMNISPKPTHVFRYFLDYSPLVTKPAVLPQAPTITPITRNGFTVVEWGGLKK